MIDFGHRFVHYFMYFRGGPSRLSGAVWGLPKKQLAKWPKLARYCHDATLLFGYPTTSCEIVGCTGSHFRQIDQRLRLIWERSSPWKRVGGRRGRYSAQEQRTPWVPWRYALYQEKSTSMWLSNLEGGRVIGLWSLLIEACCLSISSTRLRRFWERGITTDQHTEAAMEWHLLVWPTPMRQCHHSHWLRLMEPRRLTEDRAAPDFPEKSRDTLIRLYEWESVNWFQEAPHFRTWMNENCVE